MYINNEKLLFKTKTANFNSSNFCNLHFNKFNNQFNKLMKNLILKFNNLNKDTQEFLNSAICFIIVVPFIFLIASTLFNK